MLLHFIITGPVMNTFGSMKLKVLLFCFLLSVVSGLDKTWWKHTTLYEVYLQSFKDSDGDGYGDIKGLTSKLDHFVEMGLETVYVTPFYESPMNDGGYDITNYTGIHPRFGTMKDFEELVSESKTKGLKLIIDLVINHSSDEHPWFIKSVNKIEPYTNYYIWKNPKGFDMDGKPIPPTNWLSIFGGSAWKWNEKRKQFFYHCFSDNQPDINLRNPLVRNEVKEIFKFWIEKGVSGFRLDATKYLIEDDLFRDEPPSQSYTPGWPAYMQIEHIYSSDLWETYEFLHEIREFFDNVCTKFSDYERVILPEAYGMGHYIAQYFGTSDYKIAHFPLNFMLVRIFEYQNAYFYDNLIHTYLNGLPEGATPSWNVENHDNDRKARLFSEEYEQILVSWIMTLPGVAYVHYGQEIGMTGARLRKDQEVDKLPDDFSGLIRDPGRLPMQWDDTLNAGFTTGLKPYLPVSPNYWRINVKTLKKQPNSRYNFFKKLLDLRNTDTMKYGSFKSYIISSWVLAFERALSGHETYIIVMNLGSETELVNLQSAIHNLPDIMVVETAGINTGYKSGDRIEMRPQFPRMFMLRPMSVVVLSSNYKPSNKPENGVQNSLELLLNALKEKSE